MKSINQKDVTNALKNKIADNVAKNNKADENNEKDNSLLVDTLNVINDLNKKLNFANAQLQQQNQDYLSTTQFFNPSLAKDFYNMNGNALQTNSYLAVRQMIGICNNKTPGVMQTIPGINGTGTGSNNPNGTAVGLANNSNRQMSGGGLGTMILNRISYFGQMFEIQCEDKELAKAIYKYLQDVVLAGYAVIKKDGDKYLNYCCNNVQLDKDGNLKSFEAYNSAFVINQVNQHGDDENFGIIKNIGTDYVWGQWRSNGYNIWYYVMCYLMNSVDLLGIFWNRARLNKTVVLQKKGNSSTASIEAQNFIDPYQNVVTVNTVGVLDNVDDNPEKVSIENKYDVIDLGHGEETQYSFTNFTLWNDYGDNEIGIRSSPINTNTNRSISDEISPLTIKLTKIQNDFKFCLQCLCDRIEQQGGKHVEINLVDDILLNTLQQSNPSFKAEEGNETENNENNGGANNVPN